MIVWFKLRGDGRACRSEVKGVVRDSPENTIVVKRITDGKWFDLTPDQIVSVEFDSETVINTVHA